MPSQHQAYFDIPVASSPADLSSEVPFEMPVLEPIGPLRFVPRASRVVPKPKESPTKSVKAPPPPLDLPPVGLARSATPPPPSPAAQSSNPAPALIPDSIEHQTSFLSFWTDGGSTPVESDSPIALPSPLPPTLPPKEPSTPPPTPPPAPQSAALPRPGEVDADDAKATKLADELRANADRGHELMMLASQMSRMWCPTRNGSPPPLVDGIGEWESLYREKRTRSRSRSRSRSRRRARENLKVVEADELGRLMPPPLPPKSAPTPKQHTRSATCTVTMPMAMSMPSFHLIPPLPKTAPSKRQTAIPGWPSEKKSSGLTGFMTLEDPDQDGEDESRLTGSSMKFLETLPASKRQTVLTIVSSIAEESVIAFRSMSDDEDTENENENGFGGVDERSSPRVTAPSDPTVDRKATEIGYEFAKKTGKVDWAPKLVKRLSRKWVREKKGKRWVEDDYSDVLGFLRRL